MKGWKVFLRKFRNFQERVVSGAGIILSEKGSWNSWKKMKYYNSLYNYAGKKHICKASDKANLQRALKRI